MTSLRHDMKCWRVKIVYLRIGRIVLQLSHNVLCTPTSFTERVRLGGFNTNLELFCGLCIVHQYIINARVHEFIILFFFWLDYHLSNMQVYRETHIHVSAHNVTVLNWLESSYRTDLNLCRIDSASGSLVWVYHMHSQYPPWRSRHPVPELETLEPHHLHRYKKEISYSPEYHH